MSIDLPPELHWLGWIAGAPWPKGDEDTAWAVADAWRDAATELEAMIVGIETARRATMQAYLSGAAREQMGTRFDQLLAGEQSVESLVANMRETGDSAFDIGTEIQALKLTVVVTLAWLAVEIALAWLFPPTAPAVEAAAVGTTRAVLSAASQATQKAIANLALRLGAPAAKKYLWKGIRIAPTAKGWGVIVTTTVKGAAVPAIIDGSIQLGQMADGKRDEFNGKQFGLQILGGAAGAVPARAIGKYLDRGLGNGFGRNPNFGKHFDNNWGRPLRAGFVGSMSDGVGGLVGTIAAGVVTGDMAGALEAEGIVGGFVQGGLNGGFGRGLRSNFGGANSGFGSAGAHGAGFGGDAGGWLPGGGVTTGATPAPTDSGRSHSATSPAPEASPASESAAAVDPEAVTTETPPPGPRPNSTTVDTRSAMPAASTSNSAGTPPVSPISTTFDAAPITPVASTSSHFDSPPVSPISSTFGPTSTAPAAATPGGASVSETSPTTGISTASGTSTATRPGPHSALPASPDPTPAASPESGRPAHAPLTPAADPPTTERAPESPVASPHATADDPSATPKAAPTTGTDAAPQPTPAAQPTTADGTTTAISGPASDRTAMPESSAESTPPASTTSVATPMSTPPAPTTHAPTTAESTVTSTAPPAPTATTGPVSPTVTSGPASATVTSGPTSATATSGPTSTTATSGSASPTALAGTTAPTATSGPASPTASTRAPASTAVAQGNAATPSSTGRADVSTSAADRTTNAGPNARTGGDAPAAARPRSAGTHADPAGGSPARPLTSAPRFPMSFTTQKGSAAFDWRPPAQSDVVDGSSPDRTVSADGDTRTVSGPSGTDRQVPLWEAAMLIPPTRRVLVGASPAASTPSRGTSSDPDSDSSPASSSEGSDTSGPLFELTQPSYPPAVLADPADYRLYGPNFLAGIENASYQRDLEAALSDGQGGFRRYVDPRTVPPGGDKPIAELVNGPGIQAPGRNTNCFDASLSALSTFLGKPLVAAPAYNPYFGLDGPTEDVHQTRAERWLGAAEMSLRPRGPATKAQEYSTVYEYARSLGEGSALLVLHDWAAVDPATGAWLIDDSGQPVSAGGHANVIVFPEGADAPLWWDPQSGTVSSSYSPDEIDRTVSISFLPIPPGREIGDGFFGLDPDNPRIAAEPSVPVPTEAITLPHPSGSRTFGPGHLAPLENPAYQQRLEQALDDGNGGYLRYADPRSNEYGRLVNGDGHTVRGRNNNPIDATIAAISSFHGVPQVAMPRYPDIIDGHLLTTGETDGLARIDTWVGRESSNFVFEHDSLTIAEQIWSVHEFVRDLGPGSAAIAAVHNGVIDPATGNPTVDENGNPVQGSTTLLAVVFPVGEGIDGPVWWSPARAMVTETPTQVLGTAIGIEFWPIPAGSSVADGPVVTPRPSARPATHVPGSHPPASAADTAAQSGPPKRSASPADDGPAKRARLDSPEDLDVSSTPSSPAPLAPSLDPLPTKAHPVPADRELPPLSRTRPLGPGDYAPVENPRHQRQLEQFLSDGNGGFLRHVDPTSTDDNGVVDYADLINPDRDSHPGRATNQLETTLAGLATYLGAPTVAAPRYPTITADGSAFHYPTEPTGRSVQRITDWLGVDWHSYRGVPVADQYRNLFAAVEDMGEGSAALIVSIHPRLDATGAPLHDPGTGRPVRYAKYSLALYPPDRYHTIWWSPHDNRVSDEGPPPDIVADTEGFNFIPIPSDWTVSVDPALDGQSPKPGTSTTATRLGPPVAVSSTGHPKISASPVADRATDSAPGARDTGPAAPEPRTSRRPPLSGAPMLRPPASSAPVDASTADASASPATSPDRDSEPGSTPDRSDTPETPEVTLTPVIPLTDPPMRLIDPSTLRAFGPNFLAGVENASYQRDLEAALSDGQGGFRRYVDPRTVPPGGDKPIAELVNGPGIQAPGRNTNCFDASLSALSTFLGKPLVAAPAYNSHFGLEGPAGDTLLNRATVWLGVEEPSYFHDGHATMAQEYDAIYRHVASLGPGSAAYVQYRWAAIDPETGAKIIDPDGLPRMAGGHANVIVFPEGADAPLWWDPQTGEVRTSPAQADIDKTAFIRFIPIPPGREVGDDFFGLDPDNPRIAAEPSDAVSTEAIALTHPSGSRTFGPGHLAPLENPAYQQRLEQALDDGNGGYLRYADPRSNEYGRLVNGDGHTVRGRNNNPIDATIAAISSFHGVPQVAMPRYPDIIDGHLLTTGETDGLARIDTWVGRESSNFVFERNGLTIAEQFWSVHDYIRDLGPGSAAIVVFDRGIVDPATGSLVVDEDGDPVTGSTSILAVVYPVAEGVDGPVWWDATHATITATPAQLLDSAIGIEFWPIPAGSSVADGPVVAPRPAPPVADRPDTPSEPADRPSKRSADSPDDAGPAKRTRTDTAAADASAGPSNAPAPAAAPGAQQQQMAPALDPPPVVPISLPADRELPPLSTVRPLGPGHFAPLENPRFQRDIEKALADGSGGFARHADPWAHTGAAEHAYADYLNPGRDTIAGRAGNTVDTTLAGLSSYLGRPTVAAPRFPGISADGSAFAYRPESFPEGYQRISTWLDTPWLSYAGPETTIGEQYDSVTTAVENMGEGAAAVIVSIHSVGDGDPSQNPRGEVRYSLILFPEGGDGLVWWSPHEDRLAYDGPPDEIVDSTTDLRFIPIPPGWTVAADPAPADNAGHIPPDAPTGNPRREHPTPPTEGGTRDRSPGDQRSGQAVHRGGPADRADLPHRPDAGGSLAAPAAHDTTGAGQRSGDRPDHSGGDPGQRRGPRVPELAGEQGDGRLHEVGAGGHAAPRPTDPSAPAPDRPATDPREPGPDRVPDDRDIPAASDDRVRGGDPEAAAELHPGEHRRDDGRGVGPLETGAGRRDLAEHGDDLVLTPEDAPAASSPATPPVFRHVPGTPRPQRWWPSDDRSQAPGYRAPVDTGHSWLPGEQAPTTGSPRDDDQQGDQHGPDERPGDRAPDVDVPFTLR
ncbi:toxin glutamine deamidase domain-containing protein [Nocardia higoensis]|uniref:toxin glutamine deamidase domain-containing protein n=1 Tax=Nocardia higoensis TaxID=228599 RepID=UPI0002E06AA1|nr:toxin glutamine deamidase domain-containing protein [Nocardia higoensis]